MWKTLRKGSYFVLLIGLHLVPGLGVVLAIPTEDRGEKVTLSAFFLIKLITEMHRDYKEATEG